MPHGDRPRGHDARRRMRPAAAAPRRRRDQGAMGGQPAQAARRVRAARASCNSCALATPGGRPRAGTGSARPRQAGTTGRSRTRQRPRHAAGGRDRGRLDRGGPRGLRNRDHGGSSAWNTGTQEPGRPPAKGPTAKRARAGRTAPRAARRPPATGAACSPRGGSAACRPSGAASLRKGLPSPGRAADGPADPGAPPGRRIAAGADRGMAGIRHARKGADVCIPHEDARAGHRARAAPRKKTLKRARTGPPSDDLPPDQRVQCDLRRVQVDDQRPRNGAERPGRNRQPAADRGGDLPLKGPPEGAQAGPPAGARIPRLNAPQALNDVRRPPGRRNRTRRTARHRAARDPAHLPALPRLRPASDHFNARAAGRPAPSPGSSTWLSN